MLVMDPTQRITVEEALEHEYVRGWKARGLDMRDASPPQYAPTDERSQDVGYWKGALRHL